MGLLITLFSKTDEDVAYSAKILEAQKNQEKALSKIAANEQRAVPSITDELEKLTKLKNDGTISEVEFELLKTKVIGEISNSTR